MPPNRDFFLKLYDLVHFKVHITQNKSNPIYLLISYCIQKNSSLLHLNRFYEEVAITFSKLVGGERHVSPHQN